MGGKSSQSTQSTTIPPQVLAAYQSVNARANQTANTPFASYTGQFVAPINQQQTSGINDINASAGEAQPYFGAAASDITRAQNATAPVNASALGLAGRSAGAVNPTNLDAASIQKYLSPYLGTVLGSTEKLLSQQNQEAQTGALGTAIQSGAFGGDRTGLAAATLQQQQDLAAGNVYSNIANQGYQSALGAAQQQQGVNLEAGQANRAALANAAQLETGIGQTAYGEGANTATTLAGLGAGAQNAALQGAQAKIGAGTLQQQTQQAQDAALYNQFLQQQSYPFQVDQFLANIAEGTGALSGSTTTTTQPGGFFSDRRLKHNIRKIGKTYDGQHIYSYQHHNDPRIHIGLIAQEVEKKHPEAVGLARGYKMVDYGKATEGAANRGHFREGGIVAIRPGLAYGGSPELADILSQHEAMYGAPPQGQYGLAAGNVPHGGSSRVPAPMEGSHQLMASQASLRPQATGLDTANTLAKTADQYMNLYKDLSSPSKHGDPPPQDGIPIEQEAANEDNPILRGGGGHVGYAVGGSPYAVDPALTSGIGAAGLGVGGGHRSGLAGGADISGTHQPTGLVGLATGQPDAHLAYDSGGEVPSELDIPNDPSRRSLPQAPPLQQQQSSPFSSLLKLAGTAAETYGAYAALAAAKRGGRIGKDDGGSAGDDPDVLPEATVIGKRPDPIRYEGGLSPMEAPQVEAQMPAKVEAPADAPAPQAPPPKAEPGLGGTKSEDHWYQKASNVIPLLTGLAAMGTAPTRSLGVALATGLGAGTQAYLPTQQQQANIQARQIANDTNQVTLNAYRDAANPPKPVSFQQPERPSGMQQGSPDDPQELAFSKYAPVPVARPDSVTQRMVQLSFKAPQAAKAVGEQYDQQVQGELQRRQLRANADYQGYVDVSNSAPGQALAKLANVDPQKAAQLQAQSSDPAAVDQQARAWAQHMGLAAHQYSGRPTEMHNGVLIDKNLNAPVLGSEQVMTGLTAEGKQAAYNEGMQPVILGNGLPGFRYQQAGFKSNEQYVIAQDRAARMSGAQPQHVGGPQQPAAAASPASPATPPPHQPPTVPPTKSVSQPHPSPASQATDAGATADPQLKTALADQSFNLKPLPKVVDQTTREAALNQQKINQENANELKKYSDEVSEGSSRALQNFRAAKMILDAPGNGPVAGLPGSIAAELARYGFDTDTADHRIEAVKYLTNGAVGGLKAVYGPRPAMFDVKVNLEQAFPDVKTQGLGAVRSLVNTNIRAAKYDLGSAERVVPYLEANKDPANFNKWNQRYFERASNINSALPAPPVGTVRGHRRFVGGDASNAANWVPIQ